MSKKQLWIMVGVPGSGKDYWIDKHISSFNGNVKVISRDKIRLSILKDGEDYFSHEKEVYSKYIEEICNSLIEYDVVIANATHLNEKSRSKLLHAISAAVYFAEAEINAMMIKTSLHSCIEHNSLRIGRAYVPESQIKAMYSSLTTPNLNEGFDNIYIYTTEKGIPKYKILRGKEHKNA